MSLLTELERLTIYLQLESDSNYDGFLAYLILILAAVALILYFFYKFVTKQPPIGLTVSYCYHKLYNL